MNPNQTADAAMKPSLATQAIERLIEMGEPVMLWGPPGVAKSSILRQIAERQGREFIDVRASMLDPVDLRGIPIVDKKTQRTKWAAPDFLPDGSKPSLLCLDELVSAPPSMQGALYQLVLDHRCGEYVLPDNCSVVAAGNREGDRGVVYRMPTPLASRFTAHIEIKADVDDWQAWAIENDVPIEIIAWIRFRPEMLFNFDPKSHERAFACPRTIEKAGKIFQTEPSYEVEFALYRGCVGQAAAVDLLAFLRIWRKLPDPDAVLMNPGKHAIPDDPQVIWALCGALAKMADDQNFERMITFANRLPREFSTFLVSTAIARNEDLVRTKAYIKWAAAKQKKAA